LLFYFLFFILQIVSIKKLAGQTIWYGVSSIFSRFLNYLLTPYLTWYLPAALYGEMSLVYAAIPFMNVVFTYGMETTFFRFSNKENNEKHVFNIGSLSLMCTTLLFCAALILCRGPISALLRIENHPQFVTWSALIISLDTLATLPFAKLRNDGRPGKYVVIKVFGILVNIGLVVFFYSVMPRMAAANGTGFIGRLYDPAMGMGYVIMANLIASAVTLLCLWRELFSVRFEWDSKLWSAMLFYSIPLVIVGFGGVINETFDRIMLGWWSSAATEEAKKIEVGIYSACYKLSLLITLFVQAFRMGAEPFFFQQAKGENAPKTYARVMKFFVITICVMFLMVTMFIDVWKYFITNHMMWRGLSVVPVLLIANMCIGVYYNLAIWYKVANRTRAGATITVVGALITLFVNYLFIPRFGYMACAWATLLCYAGMMVISYIWGQRAYPIPYNLKKLTGFFCIMLFFYGIYSGVSFLTGIVWLHLVTGALLLLVYVRFIVFVEKKELARMPAVGKWIR
jgi:O-antigen/teichoic acid export membrane protein